MENSCENTAKALRKRALRIVKTQKLVFPLIDLHSPLEKSYWNAYHCSNELKQEGIYLTSHYCGQRWCFECNAIRSAKLINGYGPILKNFKGLQFVTLTRKNVPGAKLAAEVTDIIKTFSGAVSYIRRYKKINVQGIRKIEVTYNKYRKDFHPHLHLLVDSSESARAIIAEWLFRNPEASGGGQHTELADKNSFIELFKYATKLTFEPEIGPEQQDLIFQSIQGKRIYQPFGIKKVISEDISEITRQAYGNLEYDIYKVWRFEPDIFDWISIYHESLIDTIKYHNST